MATAPLLEDLERETDEDPMTVEIPVSDKDSSLDLGDFVPPGMTRPLGETVDPVLGADPTFIVAVSGTPSIGLNARQRIRARDLAVQAAALAVKKNTQIQYSMGDNRWDPIKRNRKAWRGEVGRFEDCSSFVTWCLWNGLDHFGVDDVVNGDSWRSGWTGSMVQHGIRVSQAEILRGDVLFYLNDHGEIGHCTIYVGGGMCITHGHDADTGTEEPEKKPMGYRTINHIRRYIH